jgi:peroxiredoxin/ribosomal protein S18 acetylase RimI-like enzyme
MSSAFHPMPHDPTQLPSNLPVPKDDGGCLHLRRALLPSISLTATNGEQLNLASLTSPTVLFFYPRTGVPGRAPSLGFHGEEWDSIPGARGCTPQSCGFRDLFSQFTALGVRVFGVSTNATSHQREFKERMHVHFELLSDSKLELTRALRLPAFEFPTEPENPTPLIARMAWYAEPDASVDTPHPTAARIRKVWYPVFPPNENATNVLVWLQRRSEVHIVRREARHDAFVRDELTRHWAGTQIWSRNVGYDADRLPALVAERDGVPIGLCTYEILPGGAQCEVVTLSTRDEGRGVGERLLDAAADIARAAGCWRIFLTTTNDNIRAIGFYQRCGWTLAAIHKGIVEDARRRGAPIPILGPSGLPVRDEIEFELSFQ